MPADVFTANVERNLITMYSNPSPVIAAGAVGTLAFTGANPIWTILAGFALLAAGSAIARIAPKRRSAAISD